MMNVVSPSRAPAHRRTLFADAARNSTPSGVAEQLVSLLDPTSVAADQYRALRYSIETFRKESSLRVMGVTSASPGDGKTVTTLNLAGALAQAQDARVLIIDADLRKPSVAAYLGLADRRSPGLTHALCDDRYELADIVHRLKEFNLSVVTAGTPTPSPYELLSSARLDLLIRQARHDYDWVIIDTPPAVLMPDCRVIERWVDGFLIVVCAHKTPRRMVAEALNQFDPAKLLGCVFNGDDRAAARYYGHYGYYGGEPSASARFWRRLTHKS
jgi:capsular exopolysaccharide synthesis family protein